MKSDVPHLKMKEFGKIDTFMILVAYCLKRLTFTFQIIKCPHVWKNLRYQNLLWLHYKYLKYWIQKIHFELGHPVAIFSKLPALLCYNCSIISRIVFFIFHKADLAKFFSVRLNLFSRCASVLCTFKKVVKTLIWMTGKMFIFPWKWWSSTFQTIVLFDNTVLFFKKNRVS